MYGGARRVLEDLLDDLILQRADVPLRVGAMLDRQLDCPAMGACAQSPDHCDPRARVPVDRRGRGGAAANPSLLRFP